MSRAIFLDRDGVICKNRRDYIKSWREFQFIPQAQRYLAELSKLPYSIVVVTNQSAIGRKIISENTVTEIHRRMIVEIEAYGGRIDRVMVCPHRPDEGCQCRKPSPGMLLAAEQELVIDLSRSFMIGDAASDVVAGQEVRCQALLVLSGRGQQQLAEALSSAKESFVVTRNLGQATRYIVESHKYLLPVD